MLIRLLRPGLIVPVLTAACGLLSAAAARADAPFAAPFALSAPSGSSGGQRVVLDAAGDAVAIWSVGGGEGSTQPSVVQASVRPAGGAFGPAVTLSDPSTNAFAADVSLDAGGDATVAFVQGSGTAGVLEVATRPAGGSFGAPVAVSAPGRQVEGGRLAEDAAGDALLAFAYYDPGTDTSVTELATRSAGGAFGAPAQVGASGLQSDGASVAMDARGDGVIAWYESGGDANPSRVYAARRPAGGVLGAPVGLSPAGDRAYDPQVVIDPSGAVTAAYDRVQSSGSSTVGSAHASTLSASGVAGPDQVLSPVSAFGGVDPVIAVDGAGTVTAAWTRSTDSSGAAVLESATAPAGQPFGPTATLDPAADATGEVAVADDAAGDTAVAAGHPADTAGRSVLRTLRRPAGGAFGAPQDLADGDDVFAPALAMRSADDLVVVWSTFLTGAIQIVGAQTAAVTSPSTPAAAATTSPPALASPVAAPPAAAAKPVPLVVRFALAAKQTRRGVLKAKVVRATCTLTTAGTCTVVATVTRATARKLHLKLKGKATTYVVATATATLPRAGTARVTFTLTAAARRAIARSRGRVVLSFAAVGRAGRLTAVTRPVTLALKR